MGEEAAELLGKILPELGLTQKSVDATRQDRLSEPPIIVYRNHDGCDRLGKVVSAHNKKTLLLTRSVLIKDQA
ncbi:MAG: hypothetical protein ACRD1X_02590 [Vicinamibacteria bacterium]